MKKHIKETILVILIITITMLISIGIANAATSSESNKPTISDVVEVEGKNKISKVQGIVISSIVVVLSYVLIKQSSYNEFFTTIKYEILLPIVFLITYFLIRGNVKAWSYTMCVVAIISGAIVNPIVRGIAPINKTDISNEIKKIYNEDKEALWIGENNFNGRGFRPR